jgi:alcohol dehydrogenase class IV
MMLGATQAGLPFSNSSVTLVHGMSRPIGAYFQVPHGLSNAMLLSAVMRFSVEGAVPRYAEAARRIGFAENGDADAVATGKLVEGLVTLNRDLAVPSPREYGIKPAAWEAKLDLMAEQATCVRQSRQQSPPARQGRIYRALRAGLGGRRAERLRPREMLRRLVRRSSAAMREQPNVGRGPREGSCRSEAPPGGR